MFVVIFLEQFLQRKASLDRMDRVRGVAWVPSRFLGAVSSMIPTMVVILLLLTVFRKPIEEKGGYVRAKRCRF